MSDATTGIFSGLALWLVPSSSSAFSTAVKEESAKLRAANPDASSKEFGVHATLLAGLGNRKITGEGLRDVAQKAVEQWREERGVPDARSLSVGFEDVVTRGRYFQCILIALDKHPALLRLNQITSEMVDSAFPPPSSSAEEEEYFPHISLLYSSISAPEAQHQIDEMKKEGIVTDLIRKPAGGEEEHMIAFRGFSEAEFVAVDVYDCTGKPEDWVKLHSIPL